jgi:hypothetical protein
MLIFLLLRFDICAHPVLVLLSPLAYSTIELPAKPILKGPPNHQKKVSVTPVLYWDTVSHREDTYNLQISTDSMFSSVTFAEAGVAGEMYEIDFKKIILNNMTPYYWRVQAVNYYAQPGAWSDIWSFTTGPKLEQKEFIVIGAWNGPIFEGTRTIDSIEVQKFKDAHFNTIITSPLHDTKNYSDYFFTTSTITPSLSGSFLTSNYNQSDFTTDADVPNEYRLSILHAVGDVSTFVHDRTVLWFDHWNPYNCLMRMNDVAEIYSHYSKYRDNMLGYYIGDEPPPSATIALNLKLNTLAAADTSKIAFYNLGASWVADTNWATYKDYVDRYIGNPNTKVVSFDNYCFDIGHTATKSSTLGNWVEDLNKARYKTGFPSALGPRGSNLPAIYAQLNLFASKVKYYKDTRKKNTTFWGAAGCSQEHYVYDDYKKGEPLSIRHLAYPTELILRFYASSNLMYGAKGIIWYTYTKQGALSGANIYNPMKEDFGVKAASNDSVIYNNLKKINGEIVKMARVLLKLEWQRTIHGDNTDPSTKESFLEICDTNTPFYFKNSRDNAFKPSSGASPTWSFDSMAVGIFKYGDSDCFIIMNKSVYLENHNTHQFKGFANSTKYVVKNNVNPRIFNKTNGSWQTSKNRLYDKTKNVTSFELPNPIGPGDMELVWLEPADSAPNQFLGE